MELRRDVDVGYAPSYECVLDGFYAAFCPEERPCGNIGVQSCIKRGKATTFVEYLPGEDICHGHGAALLGQELLYEFKRGGNIRRLCLADHAIEFIDDSYAKGQDRRRFLPTFCTPSPPKRFDARRLENVIVSWQQHPLCSRKLDRAIPVPGQVCGPQIAIEAHITNAQFLAELPADLADRIGTGIIGHDHAEVLGRLVSQ